MKYSGCVIVLIICQNLQEGKNRSRETCVGSRVTSSGTLWVGASNQLATRTTFYLRSSNLVCASELKSKIYSHYGGLTIYCLTLRDYWVMSAPTAWYFVPMKPFIAYTLHTCSSNLSNYICIYIYHHDHHVVPLARISLTLSRHISQSFIASGRSSGLHPVSSHNCWMYVRAGRPAFARPYVGVHRSTSLMRSPLLLQQCPTCLVRLTWIVFVMGGWWLYSCCLVECCRQDLFNIARGILV